MPGSGVVTSRPRRARVLTLLAGAGIVSSILIMVAASIVRSSWMYPPMAIPAAGPPWDLQSVHMSAAAATAALWLATILGAGGVTAGLMAVQNGARPSVRALLIAATLAVAALTVLPAAGSTDAFDYASYGRILALGHSPYIMTPYHLRLAHNAFARSVPVTWDHYVSVYGPLATIEQFLAAKLGGASAARIVFWLKLWGAAAFILVAVVIDRLLRSDPARRLRAHLLWTINPLLLWDLVAAGHLDVLGAAAGLLGLVMLGEQSAVNRRTYLLRAAAAGALIGVAADIKINYVLFGLALAWALRRAPAALTAAAAAALAVLVSSYAGFGLPALEALAARRNGTTADSFYTFFFSPNWRPHFGLIGAAIVIAVAVLALWRMPAGPPGLPAVRPAVALSAAWLFFWPYQLPWYDAMIICVLVPFPASRLDWLVLARLAAGTIPNIPGNPSAPPGLIGHLHHVAVWVYAPLVLLAAAIGLVALCLTGRWWPRKPPDGPAGTAAREPAEMLHPSTS